MFLILYFQNLHCNSLLCLKPLHYSKMHLYQKNKYFPCFHSCQTNKFHLFVQHNLYWIVFCILYSKKDLSIIYSHKNFLFLLNTLVLFQKHNSLQQHTHLFQLAEPLRDILIHFQPGYNLFQIHLIEKDSRIFFQLQTGHFVQEYSILFCILLYCSSHQFSMFLHLSRMLLL